MTRQRAEPDEAGVVTIYCPQCGQPMRVAGRHIEGEVACPHCGTHIDRGASPGRASRIGHRNGRVRHDSQLIPRSCRTVRG